MKRSNTRRRVATWLALMLSVLILTSQSQLVAFAQEAPADQQATDQQQDAPPADQPPANDPPADQPPADDPGDGGGNEQPPAPEPIDPPDNGGNTGGGSGGGHHHSGGGSNSANGGSSSGSEGSIGPDHRTDNRPKKEDIVSDDREVMICHRTDSFTNPYIINTPDVLSVDGVGPGDHAAEHTGPTWRPDLDKHIEWGDIIPPGTYGGITIAGQNWDADGQAIWANGCKPVEPEPGIQITKSCPNQAQPGEAIKFDITITNTGTDDLESVVVNDSLTGKVNGFASTLAAGASSTQSVTYTPGANEDPVHNAATVTAKGVESKDSVTDTDACDTDIVHHPGIKVTKSCPDTATPGEEITYTITVENTGDEPLHDVVVEDSLLGTLGQFPSTLAVGETSTKTVKYTPGADEDPVKNTVTASATGADSGDDVQDSDSCTTDIVHNPGIDVEKSCPSSTTPGQEITYSITVTNTGNEPLKNVEVNDTLLGDLSASFPDTLGVGDSVTKQFPYTPGPNDDPVHNEVTASGTGADSGKDVDDTDTCDTDVTHTPGISVTKSCPATAAPGEEISYTITVTNTGDEPLNDVTVMDSLLGDISDQFPDTLAAGASATATVGHTPGPNADPVTNTVLASGTGADSAQTVSDDDSCTTDIIHNPGIDVEKSCPDSAKPGDKISYTITVTNTGNEPLNDIEVHDTLLGDLSASFPNTLGVGDSVTKSFDYTVGNNDDPVHNEVTASGNGADSGKAVEDTDTCDTDVVHTPGISVTKSCPRTAQPGDEISYEITITNTGNETLEDVTVMDSLLGDISDQFPDTLAAGASATATVGHTPGPDDDPVTNTVLASGTGVDSQQTVSDEDSCTTDIVHEPGISVDKSCPETATPGEQISYTITVTNTGNEALEDVAVNDTLLGDLSNSYADTLAVGASETHSFTYTPGANEDPVHNVVTATANGADSGQAVEDSDSCDTDIVHTPGIDVEKSCPETAKPGEEITYTITVTNTGNEPLENVKVEDSLLGDVTASFGTTLDVGEAKTRTFTYTVTGDPTVNTVDASANGVDSGSQVSDEDTCTTDTVHTPGIVVQKSCPEAVKPGEDITYTITVTNTGDEPLNDVSVQDSILGDLSGSYADTLAVGASETHSFSHTPTTDPVINQVTASGVGADSQQTVSDQDECETNIVHNADITVSKSCIEAAAKGETITYTITVENTGNDDLTGLTVSDTLLGDLSADFPDDLAAGASVTKQFQYTITQDPGSTVHNEVTASATGVDSETAVSATATCDTDVLASGINIVKDGVAMAHVGDTVPYTMDVTNTGQTKLHDVTVSDPNCNSTPSLVQKTGGNQDDLLEVGEHWIYACEHTITLADADPLPNTATANGTDPGGNPVSDTDDHVVDVIHPAIQIIKTVDPPSGEPGDVVTYTYEVTNIGDVALHDVKVTDDKLGDIGTIPSLGVGQTVFLTQDFTLGDIDVVNIGTATGKDPLDQEVSDDDDAAVIVVLSEIKNPPKPPKTGPEIIHHAGGTLPFTGTNDAIPLIALSIALAGIGVTLTIVGRRRRTTQDREAA